MVDETVLQVQTHIHTMEEPPTNLFWISEHHDNRIPPQKQLGVITVPVDSPLSTSSTFYNLHTNLTKVTHLHETASTILG